MGTRADFYVGTGKKAEWLGSIAFDGYRINELKNRPARDAGADEKACWEIRSAKTQKAFRVAVKALLRLCDDATTPERGWPWPWDDSATTDYSYAFVGGRCKTFHWGRGANWPNMKDRKSGTLGPRSGLIVLTG